MAYAEEGGELWIERAHLLPIVQRDVRISGDESAVEVLEHEPQLLVEVSGASPEPLDLRTYRIRHERWEAGEGPRLVGMREFMETLEHLADPVRVATVTGAQTTYMLLLDATLERVLAAVAIDAPQNSATD